MLMLVAICIMSGADLGRRLFVQALIASSPAIGLRSPFVLALCISTIASVAPFLSVATVSHCSGYYISEREG